MRCAQILRDSFRAVNPVDIESHGGNVAIVGGIFLRRYLQWKYERKKHGSYYVTRHGKGPDVLIEGLVSSCDNWRRKFFFIDTATAYVWSKTSQKFQTGNPSYTFLVDGRGIGEDQDCFVPHRLGTVRDEEIIIKLATKVSPTSSEAALEQEALAKTKHDNMFKEMEEVEIAERAKASTLHKIKRLSRAKSIAFSKIAVQGLIDEPKTDAPQLPPQKKKRTLMNKHPTL